KFKEQISETLALGELEQFQSLIEDFEREQNIPAIEIAAALAKMARGNVPLLLDKNKAREQATWQDDRPVRQDRFDRPERNDRFDRNERSERPAFPKKERIQRPADAGMQTFRIEVGHQHGVKPGNIVGAIANEAGIDSKNIGRIEIYDDYSVLDLPDSMPKELLDQLKTVWVAGQQLRISRDGDAPDLAPPAAPRKPFAAKSAPAFKDAPADAGDAAPAPRAPKKERPRPGVTAYRIEVGREHAVTPSNIVGAIANEANLEAKHIGRIDIFDNYSVLDLPEGMPPEILDHLKSVVVSGQKLRISLDDGTTERKPAPPRPKSPRKTFK
ncbi:MAG: DbpA RNA binding domain-containing protein, partial [Janthinobacterium sp.]